MISLPGAAAGRFCWVDLATVDSQKAAGFYQALFGWRAAERQALGGSFSLLELAGGPVGSMYQLDRAQRSRGVPSHWTPYVRVERIEDALQRVAALGGSVLAGPLAVPGMAEVALVVDPVGAALGLWQASSG